MVQLDRVGWDGVGPTRAERACVGGWTGWVVDVVGVASTAVRFSVFVYGVRIVRIV